MWLFGRRFVIGLTLERVVQIRIPTSQPNNQRAEQIRRDEEQTPPLVLPNVHQLVVAAPIEIVWRPAKDNVSQSHGTGAANHAGHVTQEPGDAAAVKLDDAAAAPAAAAGSKRR
jgi:hypothetical protein